jgi:diadenosine tetraphosphate (Ap4A) HIT family hydrolase
MAEMNRLSLLAAFWIVGAAIAWATDCACDVSNSAVMEVRQCGLCKEAELQPSGTTIFFLKDINPRKPNRWLALPRSHGEAHHELHEMSPADRTALWTAAIAKAKSLWGEEWGLAYNGIQTRTQCHAHIHIGKLLKGIETGKFIVVAKPSQIPAPAGEGLWIHPVGSRLHVHLGEQTTETVLLR